MPRGARGGRARGLWTGRGRGGSSVLPMGLSFADILALPREGGTLYPTYDPLPVLAEYCDEDKRIAELQLGVAARLRNSPYYLVEATKSTALPRYSDRYLPLPASQPALKKNDLHMPFFPRDVFESHFTPRKRQKKGSKPTAKRLKLDDIKNDDEEDESSNEQSNDGSQQSDYDVEDDNDYVQNYFDNGENDIDDLGDGYGAGDEA